MYRVMCIYGGLVVVEAQNRLMMIFWLLFLTGGFRFGEFLFQNILQLPRSQLLECGLTLFVVADHHHFRARNRVDGNNPNGTLVDAAKLKQNFYGVWR